MKRKGIPFGLHFCFRQLTGKENCLHDSCIMIDYIPLNPVRVWRDFWCVQRTHALRGESGVGTFKQRCMTRLIVGCFLLALV